MSDQTNQWEGQPLPQEESQEIDAQELEAITGGVIEKPTPVGPNIYLYNGRPNPHSGAPAIVALHTSDISIPHHTAAMSNQKDGTVWQHVPVRQPNGEIQHTYHKIGPR